MIDFHGYSPDMISATSYGEHRPTASNDTPEGRSQNRRSVIVILPEKVAVQRSQFAGM